MQGSTSLLTQADYEAIEAAVMETSRGRWFLGEYARRHRHADTEMLLAAMGRLENVVRTESVASVDRVRSGLVDMSAAITRAKADIAALKPEGAAGRIEEATEELDSVVSATEAATGDILAAAEQVQEIAWTLRERPFEQSHCDALDTLATDIYTACSFQDLTGQRTRKVIGVLRYLESRIDAMIDLWGRSGTEGTRMAEQESGQRMLLNGPARPGQGLGQSDVDFVMGGYTTFPPAISASPAGLPQQAQPAARILAPVIVDDVVWGPETDDADDADDAGDAAAEPEWPPEGAPLPVSADLIPEADARTSDVAGDDPLAPLAALSREQKIALFT
jgi:chemotaxis protein CheZ